MPDLRLKGLCDGWRGALAGYWSYAKNIHSGREGDLSCGYLAFPLGMVDRRNRNFRHCRALSCAEDWNVAYGLFTGNPRPAFGHKAGNKTN